VKIQFDRERIGSDLHKGGERIHDALEKSSSAPAPANTGKSYPPSADNPSDPGAS
jgi:hypothetical protein